MRVINFVVWAGVRAIGILSEGYIIAMIVYVFIFLLMGLLNDGYFQSALGMMSAVGALMLSVFLLWKTSHAFGSIPAIMGFRPLASRNPMFWFMSFCFGGSVMLTVLDHPGAMIVVTLPESVAFIALPAIASELIDRAAARFTEWANREKRKNDYIDDAIERLNDTVDQTETVSEEFPQMRRGAF